MRLSKKMLAVGMSVSLLAMFTGCGAPETAEPSAPTVEVTEEIAEASEEPAEDIHMAESEPYVDENEASLAEESEEAEEAETEAEEALEDIEYLPGYDSEYAFKSRHTGSVSYVDEPTVLVSIFIDEEEDVWSEAEKQIMLNNCRIGYSFIENTLKDKYDTEAKFIYDWEEDPELVYQLRIYENIDSYITLEGERHMDEVELSLVEQVPYKQLMEKYDTTSIGFLYMVPHEGCSYSSMHFIDDDTDIWNEGCLLYLQDMYSDSLDYETPTTFAHELLHLFGAEDYYSSAAVFSKETYKQLETDCADDLMLNVADTINGVYTIYHDAVYKEITPVTAYMVGAADEDAIENLPELEKAEKGCFAGSAYDREF